MTSRFLAAVPALLFFAAVAAASPPPGDFQPDPKSVRRDGSAYRYPQAGWDVLHIEGGPYERGHQHGTLMAEEIAHCVKGFAAMQSAKAPADGWKQARVLTSALFLRKFDREYLEEMQGIADGAAAAGATFARRPIDLLDIATLNCWPEVDTLDSALDALPTGLEGIEFPKKRQPQAHPPTPPGHCSAFAAVGSATADGKIVFGHITMFNLMAAQFFNVWLDVKPSQGHRVIIQTFPGGIQSSLDYYMNDAGILITETTIAQTRYEINSAPLANRIRKAVQYADDIDSAVRLLSAGNNGLYTNEWLLADVKANEIAMFELGTHKNKLWRSSKGEWFGGTEGFYWGCNNAKDLEVRLETIPAALDRPANMVWRPSPRDQAWISLYRENRGKIGPDFARLAFTSAPLAAYHSLDAKFTTTDLAKELKSWGLFGAPRGRTWLPTDKEKAKFADIRPLVCNPWALLTVTPPTTGSFESVAIDLKGRLDDGSWDDSSNDGTDSRAVGTVWHGTLLPKTDSDVWLAAAFSDYERIVALERAMLDRGKGKLNRSDRDYLDTALFSYRTRYAAAARSGKDTPLAETHADVANSDWYDVASGKGVLLLNELRTVVGAKTFDAAMDAFGRKHAGREVTAAEFFAAIESSSGRSLTEFTTDWLTKTGLPERRPNLDADGVFSVKSFDRELERTLIVYGTRDEVPTNREAADLLQQAIRASRYNYTVPIKSDAEVGEADLKEHHVLLIGRPNTNAVVERFRDGTQIRFGAGSFALAGADFAHPDTAVVSAAPNPLNGRYSVVILTGLGPASTRTIGELLMRKGGPAGSTLLIPHNGKARYLTPKMAVSRTSDG